MKRFLKNITGNCGFTLETGQKKHPSQNDEAYSAE